MNIPFGSHFLKVYNRVHYTHKSSLELLTRNPETQNSRPLLELPSRYFGQQISLQLLTGYKREIKS